MNKKRILIVDDEISFTRLLKLNLEQTNDYVVRVENRAEDTLTTARDFRPDLVLLDIMMPRMFGGDIAARLRADADLKTTPIVFFTAAVSKTRVKEHDGVISGFPFLAKPASVEEVIEQIELGLVKLSPRGNTHAPLSRLSPLLEAIFESSFRNAIPRHREFLCYEHCPANPGR
jgi:DNA-binding response OmpR family regulator